MSALFQGQRCKGVKDRISVYVIRRGDRKKEEMERRGDGKKRDREKN